MGRDFSVTRDAMGPGQSLGHQKFSLPPPPLEVISLAMPKTHPQEGATGEVAWACPSRLQLLVHVDGGGDPEAQGNLLDAGNVCCAVANKVTGFHGSSSIHTPKGQRQFEGNPQMWNEWSRKKPEKI